MLKRKPRRDMETTTVKLLAEGNALKVYQFGEFILYRLEGQYGVFAPLPRLHRERDIPQE